MAQRYQLDSVVRIQISGAAGVGLGWCYGCEYSRSGPGHKIKISPYGDDMTDEFGDDLLTEYDKGPYQWRRVLKLVSYSDHWTRGIDNDYLEESEQSFWFDSPKVEGVPEDLVPLFTAVACRIEGYREITEFLSRCSDDRVKSILAHSPFKLWGPYQQVGDQEKIEQLIEVSSLYNTIFAMAYGMGGDSFRLFPRLRALTPHDLTLRELLNRGQRINVEFGDTYDHLRSCYDKLIDKGPIDQSEADSLVRHNRKTIKDMFRRLRQEFGRTPSSDLTVEGLEPSLTIQMQSRNHQFNKEIQ
ncbi:MAG: hypothetical protein ACKOFA_06260 [Rhodoluna sp.]